MFSLKWTSLLHYTKLLHLIVEVLPGTSAKMSSMALTSESIRSKHLSWLARLITHKMPDRSHESIIGKLCGYSINAQKAMNALLTDLLEQFKYHGGKAHFMVHGCSPSTRGAEAGASPQVWGKPGPHNELKAGLISRGRPCLKKQNDNNKYRRRKLEELPKQ